MPDARPSQKITLSLYGSGEPTKQYDQDMSQSQSTGPEVIKLFLCSNQLSTKFILLINFKMPTIVGILTSISMINVHLRDLKQEVSSFVGILVFMSR